MDLEFAASLIISIVLGFMIGLQREINTKFEKSREFAGARTFAIISLIGYLSAYLTTYNQWIFPFVLFGLIIFLTYTHSKVAVLTKDIGTTTEFTAIVTLIVGSMLFFKDKQSAIFVTVLVLVLLELKSKLEAVEGKIEKKDISSAILFSLMSFVILPVLPNKTVDPYGILNPYQIWLMVILISGLSFFGYISVKFLDIKKSILIIGFFGGLISSTAVALSLSKRAFANKELSLYLAIAIGIASTIMFFRVIIEVAIVDNKLLDFILFPFLIATFFGYLYLYFLYKRSTIKDSLVKIEFKNPLELKEAIKIGLIFGIVYGAISLAKDYFDLKGVYLVSILSGITDVDAITLSIANMSADGKFDLKPASIAIVLASISNSLSKMFIVLLIGGWSIARFMIGFFLVVTMLLSLSFYFLVM